MSVAARCRSISSAPASRHNSESPSGYLLKVSAGSATTNTAAGGTSARVASAITVENQWRAVLTSITGDSSDGHYLTVVDDRF